jgi:outer membrane protein assembly factor BamB
MTRYVSALCSRRVNAMKLKSLSALFVIMCGCMLLTGCLGTSVVPGGWSGPVVFNGSVYYGSMDRHIVKLDLINSDTDTEDIDWDWQYPQESALTTYFYSSPVVAGDMVYIGGYSGKVYSINIDSARKEWQFPEESGDFIGNIVGDPIISGNVLYIGSSDKKLYALDVDDGTLVWSRAYETGGKIWATPVVYNGTVFIGSFDHKMYALDALTGELKWTFEAGGAIVSTPVIYNEAIYFGSLDQKFYAVDIATGDLKQGFTPFKADNWFWGKAVLYNGNIIAASLNGKVYSLDAESGSQLWEAETGGSIRGNPALVGDRVVVGTDEGNSTGKVYCFDADNGDQVWVSMSTEDGGPMLGAIRASIGSNGNMVYVHTNQKIYAFNASSSDTELTYLWIYQSGDGE